MAGLVLAASACGGGGEGAGETTTSAVPTTAESSTTTSVVPGSPEDEAAVLAALDRYWEAVEKAQNAADPDHADLLAAAQGDALKLGQDAIRQVQEKHWTRRSKGGVPLSHGKVMQIDGNTAKAWECVIDDGVVYDVANRVAEPEQVWSYTFDVVLTREAGGWVVTGRTLSAQEEGRRLCPMLPQH